MDRAPGSAGNLLHIATVTGGVRGLPEEVDEPQLFPLGRGIPWEEAGYGNIFLFVVDFDVHLLVYCNRKVGTTLCKEGAVL